MLFTELPFLDRFAAAADAGFTAVEFMFPYDHDPDDIAQRLSKYRLKAVLFNLPPGNWDGGDRGRAIFSDAVDEFRSGVDAAIRYASALNCSQLHCLAGIFPADGDAAAARRTYIDNLRFASERCGQHGIAVLIEPINTIDMPGYFLDSTEMARAIIADVAFDCLRLQFDVYHMSMMGNDVLSELTRNVDLISHVQIADVPGRHEPGSGTVDFAAVFRHLDTLDYQGWVGLEYRPTTTTSASLAWLRDVSS